MKKINIFAGPWVGEFGWELFEWQGFLRFLAMQEKHDKFTVCCRTGHDYLYQDIATDIVNYDPPSGETNMWMNNDWRYVWPEGYDLVWKPDDCRDKKQAFVKFGRSLGIDNFPQITIHARSTDKVQTGYRNWSKEKWEKFVDLYPNASIISIGSVKDALHIKGTEDMRGVSLEKLANTLYSTKVLVGPSSGPMHFGSLCGTPHVTWSPKNTTAIMSNKKRYEETWNPHKTPVTFLELGWDPSVDEVALATKEYYEN